MVAQARAAVTQGAIIALAGALAFTASQSISVPPQEPLRYVWVTLVVALVAAPFVMFGVYAGRRFVGLAPAPLLGRFLRHDELPRRAVLIPAVAVAGALGLIVGSIPLSFMLPPDVGATADNPLELMSGAELLVAFLLVIDEEIVFRLVILLPVAALLRARVVANGRVPDWRAWTAILIAGVLFGLAHIGNVAFLTNVTVEQWVIYSIAQKGILGGGIFGYILWRWGLEAAILSHYGANVMLALLGFIAESAAG